MRLILITTLLFISCVVCPPIQAQSSTHDGDDYKLDLPSPSWRVVRRVDVHEHPEFMNGEDPAGGHLRLNKKFVKPGTTTEDLFRDAEKWNLQRLPGYVACSNGAGTEFSGHLKGTVFSYEFSKGGKSMDGRIYYLQLDGRTFYVLHFTVASEKLSRVRAEMDSIAQSFRSK